MGVIPLPLEFALFPNFVLYGPAEGRWYSVRSGFRLSKISLLYLKQNKRTAWGSLFDVEARRSWDLIYDESRATSPVGYLLPVHPGFVLIRRKQLGMFGSVNEKGDPRVSQVWRLGLGGWVGFKGKPLGGTRANSGL